MRITRTLAGLGALGALAACSTTTDASVVTKPTEPVETTEADMTVDQEATVDEIALEITWSTLPAGDQAEMCEYYHMLTADQMRRMIDAYAPEIDADAFMALLDKEC